MVRKFVGGMSRYKILLRLFQRTFKIPNYEFTLVWDKTNFYVKAADLNKVGHKNRWKLKDVLQDLHVEAHFKSFKLKTKRSVQICPCLLLSDALFFLFESYTNEKTNFASFNEFIGILQTFSLEIEKIEDDKSKAMNYLENLSESDTIKFIKSSMKSKYQYIFFNGLLCHYSLFTIFV